MKNFGWRPKKKIAGGSLNQLKTAKYSKRYLL
jgi:hypothetical protein